MANRNYQDSARVEFRMAPDLKSEVEEAAELLGTTLTAFATEALVQRARQVKREHQLTILDDVERDAFLKLIASPPPPSNELKKLMHVKVIL